MRIINQIISLPKKLFNLPTDVPSGGKRNQVLVKRTGVNNDAIWRDFPDEMMTGVQSTTEIVFSKNVAGKVVAHLHQTITNKLAKALVTPAVTPTEDTLVAVDNTGAQTMIKVGTGLEIVEGVLQIKSV